MNVTDRPFKGKNCTVELNARRRFGRADQIVQVGDKS
jgi:hypothetical protein